jgi:histidyl-tRNA synthetase
MKKARAIKAAKGMQDLLPAKFLKVQKILGPIRECFESFGYQPIELPIIEPLELHLVKTGEEVRSKMYTFKDKAERDLCLRPELTASVVRAYINSLKMEPKPVKVYYVGPAFRYERPQMGRYRQFTHAGIELFGSDDVRADAEVIYLASKALGMTGLRDFRLAIGNVAITLSLLEKLGLGEGFLGTVIESLEGLKKEETTIEAIEARFGKVQQGEASSGRKESLSRLLDYIKTIVNIKGRPDAVLGEVKKLTAEFDIDEGCVKKLEELTDNLSYYDLDWDTACIDLGFGRGLEYYTGLVFEIEYEGLGAQKQVCGGGRYDNLVQTFGGESTPALGFAYGVERLAMALEAQEKSEAPSDGMQKGFSDLFIVPLDEDSLRPSLALAGRLRAKGLKVEADLSFKNLRKALRYADRTGACFIALIGEEERASASVKIKEMKTGEERLFAISDSDAISAFVKAP